MAARKKKEVYNNPSILEYFKSSGTGSSGNSECMTETAESSLVTRQDGDDADDSEETIMMNLSLKMMNQAANLRMIMR